MVLCYHAVSDTWPDPLAVSPSAFERHLRLLVRRRYRPADLDSAAHEWKRLHVTFDDAYRSIVQAVPLLEQLQMPATVFACSALAENGAPLAVPELQDRSAAFPQEVATLDWEGLRALADRRIEIGSHTVTHPHLTHLSDDELARELEESRQRIENEVGRPCRYLAYPYGEQDVRVRKAARSAGYAAAFALAGSGEPLGRYGLPRVDLYRKDGLLRFTLKTAPLPLRHVAAQTRRGPRR